MLRCKDPINCASFEVLSTMPTENQVFWDVTPCQMAFRLLDSEETRSALLPKVGNYSQVDTNTDQLKLFRESVALYSENTYTLR
jgi:hypothetical protein